MSIIGFDDIPEAAHFWPPLTTVRQDFAELGRRCVALLLGDIEDLSDDQRRAAIVPELIVRGSTGRRRPSAVEPALSIRDLDKLTVRSGLWLT